MILLMVRNWIDLCGVQMKEFGGLRHNDFVGG
jgi:hypothetical protein